MTNGDAVQHRSTKQVGVVVERIDRRRLLVSLENGTETVWYTANVEVR